ncbi:MAG TPA: hypothetical protein VFJ97_07315 [Dermatophilaceae bacterium]|nr:hypothetical protein [Dermatophilaceae bacterium]
MTTATAVPPRARTAVSGGVWPRAALGVLVVLAASLGVLRAVSDANPASPLTLRVGGVEYTVLHADQVKGLSDADLSGMSHGVQSLVTDSQALVRVDLRVTAGDEAVAYDASALRAISSAERTGITAVGGSLQRGRLGAHGSVEGSVSFVVPRNGASISLGTAPGQRAVPLLVVDEAAGSVDEHPHSDAGPATPTPATP